MVDQARILFTRFLAAVCLFLMLAPGQTVSAQTNEIRAYWADAFHSGMKNSNQVNQLLADLRAGNFNTVVVQIRKRGDAYYDGSPYEPKALDISPSDFDPLAYLIKKAHDTNEGPRIDVHGWLVTYNIWNNQTEKPTQPTHPYNLHPDWLTRNSSGSTWDGGNYCFDQGHPAVQQHTYNVAMDIVSRYDIDGINFDYIRYNGNTWGYNTNTIARFNQIYNQIGVPASTNSLWLQFRRDQVTALVRKIYINVMAIKPHVKVSGDTITWAPAPTSDTSWTNSARPYIDILQDWRSWMEEGILDLHFSMTYFRQEERPQDYIDWCNFIKDHRYQRQAVIGPGIYMNNVSNAILQMRVARELSPAGNIADGVCGYSYAVPNSNGIPVSIFNTFLTGPSDYDPIYPPIFSQPVQVPPMPWKVAPAAGHLRGFVYAGNSKKILDGATLVVRGPQTKFSTSDGTGFYGYANLLPGTYTVTALMRNYGIVTSNLTIAPGAVTTINLRLPEVDTDPARIKDLYATNITSKTAEIYWLTDEVCDSAVEYGPTTAYGSLASIPDFSLAHNLTLSNLVAGTTYHYRVRSKDPSGNEVVSSDYTFSAGPNISNVRAQLLSSQTALIRWNTDALTDSTVEVGTNTDYNMVASDYAQVVAHSLQVTGLTACTTYHYRVRSRDLETGYEAVSPDYLLTTGPIITNLQAVILNNQTVDIVWNTDLSSDSTVEFGFTPLYGGSASDASLVQSHAVRLSALAGCSTYHFRVRSRDAVGGEVVSSDFTFQTGASSVGDIIIDNTDASRNGTWTLSSSATDKYGADYRYKSKGIGSYYLNYAPELTVSGNYRVYEWHSAGSNRTREACYVINSVAGLQTNLVNQQINGGQWNLLGTFQFSAGGDNYIQITDLFSDTGIVVADAIKLVHEDEPSSTVLDNPEAVYSGLWTLGSAAPGFIGGYYRAANTVTGPATSVVTYAPQLERGGKYNVSIWYPQGSGFSTNAKVLTVFNGGFLTTNINQTVQGGQWVQVASSVEFLPGNSGYVQISNDTGEANRVVICDAVRFDFAPPPSIIDAPQSQIADLGKTATWSVVARGTPPLSYQWQFNGTDIPGATDSTYSRSNVQPADVGSYTVIVSNPICYRTSEAAILTVNYRPEIVTAPRSKSVKAGARASFTVQAVGTAPLSYQWQFNGDNLPGATTSALVFPNASPLQAGQYSVVVSNPYGLAGSDPVNLTVSPLPPPEIEVVSSTSKQVRFLLNSDPGATFALDISSNLVDWTTVTNVFNQNGSVYLSDPIPPIDASRFYRARWLP